MTKSHEKVLCAIGDAAKFTSMHRFFYIIKALQTDDKDAKVGPSVFCLFVLLSAIFRKYKCVFYQVLCFQMSAMVLINALISHADSVEFKIHLRSDFNRCGLISTLDNLKANSDPEDQIIKQIQVFEKCAQQNFEELELNFENIQSTWEG